MYRKFILFNLVLVFCVVVLGAYVRLSDAGLGCPDWPGCYGQLTVPETPEEIAKANEAYPDRPLEKDKAWKEMLHRYLAGIFGILILVLTVASLFRRQQRANALGSMSLILCLVIFQAALGMWTVTFKVNPLTVLGHLLMGMLILYLLFWCYLRSNPNTERISAQADLKWISSIALFVLFVQIALGGWTSSNYAALACADFPTCFGSWWPEVDYRQAFNFWPEFGLDYEGGVLDIDARAAIHWTHRLGAVLTFIVLSTLALKASGASRERALRKAGALLSILLFAQITLGIGNVILRMPVIVAVAHNAVAGLMLLSLAFIRYRLTWQVIPSPEGVAVTPVSFEPDHKASADTASIDIADQNLQVAPEVYLEKPAESLLERLRSQLNRTRSGLADVLVKLPSGKKSIDQETIEDLEANLLMADVGVDATAEIIENLNQNVKSHELNDSNALITGLKEQLQSLLEPCSKPLEIKAESGPFVILVVGVNGVGKTTSIGKLAKRLQFQGYSIMLAAGDTFRAAAIEQLQAWGERNDIQVIAQQPGADSASVIFDALQSAKARGVDVLIADTAGRLHTKSNLMEELKKIKRIIGKLDNSAPHEILLVLDAGTGQNALPQVDKFNQALGLTGIALTKLDGTAKGGIIFALAKRYGIPIRFIGIGEGIDDLQDFDAKNFVAALLGGDLGESA